jgi:hypothetical protein
MFGVRATILTTREAAFYHLIAIVRRGGPSDQEIPYVPLLCELAEIPPDQRACYNALSSRPYRLSANPMARCIFSTTSPTPAPTVRSRSSHLCPRADPARRASPVRHQMPLVRRGPRLRIFPAHGARPYELRLTRQAKRKLALAPDAPAALSRGHSAWSLSAIFVRQPPAPFHGNLTYDNVLYHTQDLWYRRGQTPPTRRTDVATDDDERG